MFEGSNDLNKCDAEELMVENIVCNLRQTIPKFAYASEDIASVWGTVLIVLTEHCGCLTQLLRQR
jgi:hypothetical protein